MNQSKIGIFLKQLRKNKGLTQEQLAEHFYVSTRTVSRWETGSNLPDIATLIVLADFYGADIREIIEGEKKSENMVNETQTTLAKVAEYATKKTETKEKKLLIVTVASGIFMLISTLLFSKPIHGFLYGIVSKSTCNIITMITGILAYIILLILALHAFNIVERVKKWIRRSKNADA